MTNSLLNVLMFATLPVVAAVVGAVIAVFRPPSPIIRSYIQHLAAGVVFAVVAVELLPDITSHNEAYVAVAIGFILGVGSMLALKTISHKLEGKGSEFPVGLLVGVGIDILLDGFLIGISFAAGVEEGVMLTVALTVDDVVAAFTGRPFLQHRPPASCFGTAGFRIGWWSDAPPSGAHAAPLTALPVAQRIGHRIENIG